jgi:serine protease AprX
MDRCHGGERGRFWPLVIAGGLAAGVTLAGPTPVVTAVAAPTAPTASGGSAFQDKAWGDDETREDEAASAETGTWTPEKDAGSMYSSERTGEVDDAWGQKAPDGGRVTGAGVDIALIDTGVAPVAGLTDRVINGPDLSFESQAPNLRHLDGFGHGTHMAGVIAGADPVAKDDYRTSKDFVGVAPKSRIINLKVATADGGADVTQVIAAIDWAVAHRKSNGLNIRVINLSYGTDSKQGYEIDPLAYAVENAWRHGIVVVVAAGNDGNDVTSLTMPAANPRILAVGATDHEGSTSRSDDVVADFTNGGSSTRRPDLLAPGKSLVSLRVDGSMIDSEHPEGRVTGDESGRFFRGSGTSQAAAYVSGAAALLLQQSPNLTPDQVKAQLVRTAEPLKEDDSPIQGAGLIDLKRALKEPVPSVGNAAQPFAPARGTGSLEASRGGSHVVDPETGDALMGEQDIFGQAWDAEAWTTATALGRAWSGGTWNARRWSGDTWSGSSWASGSWESAEWSGRAWSGRAWSGRAWSGRTWSGRAWSGRAWSGRAWSGSQWEASGWSTAAWGSSTS